MRSRATPVTDFLIVGSGIAGLRAAIGSGAGRPRPHPDQGRTRPRATPATRRAASPRRSATTTAPALHAADTIRAGDGLCDEAAVRVLVEDGPRLRPRAARVGRAVRSRRRRPAGARPRGGAQRPPRAARGRRDRPRDRPRAVGARQRRCRRSTTIDHALVTELHRRGRPRRAASRYFDRDGRAAEVRARRDAAGDRRRRPGVPRDDESGGRDRRRHRARVSRRRARRRSRVRPVSSDRAQPSPARRAS